MSYALLEITEEQIANNPTALQTGSASRDIALGGYTDQNGSVTGLFSTLRDSLDSSFIASSLSPAVDDLYIDKLDGFNPPADNGASVTIDFKYEKLPALGDVIHIIHSFYQGDPRSGGTLIHSKTYSNIPFGLVADHYTANFSAVTNWGDLWETIATGVG